jgi:hypothetical protein
MEAGQSWFLSKHEDGSVFGPVPFDTLRRWAATAQIAPHDKLSHDQQTWLKAPMIPELEMDWLVEVTSERYYGPTTLGAVQEFLRLGEIGEETFVINSCNGTRRRVRELTDLLQLPTRPEQLPLRDLNEQAPATTTMSIDLRERIYGLEQSLREERRALAKCESRYRELEARYLALEQGNDDAAA